MFKRGMNIFIVSCLFFGLCVCLSLWLSNYRLNKYNNSVVNDEIVEYTNIDYIYEKTNKDVIYVFLYDKDNDDCIYLDEVLLKEISNNHGGMKFEDIYKVEYEQSYRSYITQLIKNRYQVSSFPAIVTLKRTNDGYVNLDCFEYGSGQTTNLNNLEQYLQRNSFFTIIHKD